MSDMRAKHLPFDLRKIAYQAGWHVSKHAANCVPSEQVSLAVCITYVCDIAGLNLIQDSVTSYFP
jgi:hypothetical protein